MIFISINNNKKNDLDHLVHSWRTSKPAFPVNQDTEKERLSGIDKIGK